MDEKLSSTAVIKIDTAAAREALCQLLPAHDDQAARHL